MKNFLCLFSALTLVLASCSNDDNNNSEDEVSAIVPKTLNYTSIDFPSENETYVTTYKGNKIVSSKDSGGRTDYIYEGNLIVKEVNYDTESESGKDVKSDEIIYVYANGKLASSYYNEGFSASFPDGQYKRRKVFTHNIDGTVKVEKYNTNSTSGIEVKSNYIEVLTFANGNLVKSVESNSESNDTFTATYEYDAKNNPLKNILGFSLLIEHSEGEGANSSVNNVVKYTVSYSVNAESNVYKRELVYDGNGFPTKITNYKKDGVTVNLINEYTY
ncbi:hypothetical protein OIU80_02405 [Flavobacterium sp. LS1R47]|jgi:hypothetical protein|uniref:Antitoxin component YwqK of YwqJK toxin-antitoxin module n=1 Tax=Flavobacterium frigoritolerans TaxID=2987686 RepID=A0A9X3C7E1_9FLAO|nr:hypothetical protein [Flavobacterium frigoritolerans]MCV9931122.1 hypothetical protein [Flavobacterium frigoritolerans]